MHRAKRIRSTRVRMEAWRQRRTGEKEKTCLTKKLKNRLDSDRPSHGRPLRSKTPRRPGCGGDEGFVRREVVAVAHAAEGDGDGARRGVEVAGGVQTSAALEWATCFEWN